MGNKEHWVQGGKGQSLYTQVLGHMPEICLWKRQGQVWHRGMAWPATWPWDALIQPGRWPQARAPSTQHLRSPAWMLGH